MFFLVVSVLWQHYHVFVVQQVLAQHLSGCHRCNGPGHIHIVDGRLYDIWHFGQFSARNGCDGHFEGGKWRRRTGLHFVSGCNC